MSSPITLNELISTMLHTAKDLPSKPTFVSFQVALRPLDSKGTTEVVAANVSAGDVHIYGGDISAADAPMKIAFSVPICRL